MKNTHRYFLTMLTIVVSVAFLLAMVGCAQGEQQQDAATQNRAYMSRANTAMMQLNSDLEPFTAAVAAEDVVTMEQAATNVYRDIESFKAISAPEAMKDIHAEYCAGCDDLKAALQSYVACYKDASDTSVDELNEALATVQQQYDSGIAHLQAADKMVTELTGALPESSSSAAAAESEVSSSAVTAESESSSSITEPESSSSRD